MKNFYISDYHFNHQNIIKFDNRPFKDLQEMKDTLIKNWNEVVSKQDTTYILGDFCWSRDEKDWVEILDQLTGSKVLIRGNHDLKKFSTNLKSKFADIKSYKELTDNGKHVILCHYPILLHKATYNPNNYMLCGHVHVTREDIFLDKWKAELKITKQGPGDACGNIINVGCMKSYMNYTPKTLQELINLTEKEDN